MNAPIVRLFVFVLLLFGGLVGFTSRWAVFDAESSTRTRRTAGR